MSCPHTETTAVLAAFGEAPPEFEEHLSACEACRHVLQQHTSTLAALEPLMHSTPVQTKRWSPPAVVFLIAAAVLLAVQFTTRDTDDAQHQIDSPIHAQTITLDVDPFNDHLDDDLASLELQLDLFHLEES
jgi:hypothetical protein